MALRGLLEGAVRKEMKNRVDEVLAAGKEWNQTAKQLATAIENLTTSINEGKVVDPAVLQPISSNLKKLIKPTAGLTKAFEKYNITLTHVAEKL